MSVETITVVMKGPSVEDIQAFPVVAASIGVPEQEQHDVRCTLVAKNAEGKIHIVNINPRQSIYFNGILVLEPYTPKRGFS